MTAADIIDIYVQHGWKGAPNRYRTQKGVYCPIGAIIADAMTDRDADEYQGPEFDPRILPVIDPLFASESPHFACAISAGFDGVTGFECPCVDDPDVDEGYALGKAVREGLESLGLMHVSK